MGDTVHYPLAESSWDAQEIKAIERVVASNMFSMGAEVAAFEKQFAEYVGSKFCVMVNSGSSANLLMVSALRYRSHGQSLQAGNTVIVPAVSWSTSYFPFAQHGVKLKFVDIDSETLNYDLNALAQAIDGDTHAILAVNLLGNPNDFDAIKTIIGKRDIILLEDNCESMGATFGGKHCGTFGVMGSFSCFFSHHISTMEGGLIVTDDEELYQILLCLRAHGWTRNLPDDNLIAKKHKEKISRDFHFVLPGYNVRPLEMSGAIGQVQLEKLPELIKQRRKNAVMFQQVMQSYPQFRTQREIGKSSWFGFAMILNDDVGVKREQIIQSLEKHHIDYRPIVSGNFTRNKDVMRWIEHEICGALPNADRLDENGLFVGNHGRDLSRELEVLDNALQEGFAT